MPSILEHAANPSETIWRDPVLRSGDCGVVAIRYRDPRRSLRTMSTLHPNRTFESRIDVMGQPRDFK
jgi:hypothetical protein